MKKVFVLILFAPFFMLKGQSNYDYDSGIVQYGVEINKEAFKKVKRNSDNKEISNRSLSVAEKVLTTLKKFFSADTPYLLLNYHKDEYILKPIEILPSEGLNEKFIYRSSVYYGNTYKDIYIKELDRKGKTYLISYKDDYDWEIKTKHKNILGFNCRKAVLILSKKVRITAWFTPQIPVAFTPVKYNGLPGAILEVTTPMKHIYAKDIKFKEDVDVEKPTEGIKLSKEEYQEMMTRFKPD